MRGGRPERWSWRDRRARVWASASWVSHRPQSCSFPSSRYNNDYNNNNNNSNGMTGGQEFGHQLRGSVTVFSLAVFLHLDIMMIIVIITIIIIVMV